jgi:hypothetical protein
MTSQVSENINTVIIDGRKITIRPIRHTDTCLEEYFIEHLSEKTRHNRFLGTVKQLNSKELQRLCDVDYHDSMAFVATIDEAGKEREVGVARYVKDNSAQAHELAVTVADEFIGSGVGQVLVETLVTYGNINGVKTLYSMDSSSNSDMRKLAKELGMSVKGDPNDSHQVIYSLNVDAQAEKAIN